METSVLTTGIGSLPHHNVDSAIEYSFLHDIPYLPQLPLKNDKEYMIQQALEHFPGLMPLNEEKETQIDLKEWLKKKDSYGDQLDKASRTNDFSFFSPSKDLHCAWSAFLFELEEREIKKAKVQLAGPLTVQLLVKLSDGDSIRPYSELLSQVFATVTLQAVAMVEELKAIGVEPIIFLDEPGFYAFNFEDPAMQSVFQELSLTIQVLKKHGASVGLHCCCNTNWGKLMQLPLDYLSMDADLSLAKILGYETELSAFLSNGGNLALGIVPTNHNSQVELDPSFEVYLQLFQAFFNEHQELKEKMLSGLLLTPACGLAFKSGRRVERILGQLKKFKDLFSCKF